MHRYVYAGGDPVNQLDPRGWEALEEAGITGFGLKFLNTASEKFLGELAKRAGEIKGNKVAEIIKNTAEFYENAGKTIEKIVDGAETAYVGVALTTRCEFEIVSSAFDIGGDAGTEAARFCIEQEFFPEGPWWFKLPPGVKNPFPPIPGVPGPSE
jgi:hypothetical protein